MRISARAIIPHEDKYLLVKNQVSPDFWCLPGGGIEPGEEVTKALEREIIEEIGVKPTIGNLLFVHQMTTKDGLSPPGLYFHVSNGQDFFDADYTKATHRHELAEIAFVDIYRLEDFRPKQIIDYLPKIEKTGFDSSAKVIID